MSKPRNYWHNMVKKMVMRFPDLMKEETVQARQYSEAITKAIEQTLLLENGEDRIKAVDLVCFKHKYTIEGAADQIHYSPRTVQRWINSFVNMVGRYVGF